MFATVEEKSKTAARDMTTKAAMEEVPPSISTADASAAAASASEAATATMSAPTAA